MSYIRGTVREVRSLAKGIREYSIELDSRISPSPGQFAMLWIPRIGEIPLSFADADQSMVKFIIARVGRVTTFIHENIEEDSIIYIRGPLGRGFRISPGGNCLLIGGGYGLAPLYFLAKKLVELNCKPKALLGFKSGEDVFYRNEFERICDVEISTEDGSYGFRGTVIDLMRKILERSRYDIVYACGREEMLLKAARLCVEKGIPIEVSLERYIRCGLGVCGSCVIEPLGLRVCRDGPVFDGRILLMLESGEAK